MGDTSSGKITLVQEDGFLFRTEFKESRTELMTDEAIPVGKGRGPSPEELIAAGAANCLANSIFFAVSKYGGNPSPVKAEAGVHVTRNEKGRLRLSRIDADIYLAKSAKELPNIARALSRFEDFCTVASAISPAVPVHVRVFDGEGLLLKDGDVCFVSDIS